MADAPENMFAREVDFRLEDTDNAYAACRGLSVRARDINRRFRDTVEAADVEQPSPTVGALADYSSGRIDLSDEEVVAASAAPARE